MLLVVAAYQKDTDGDPEAVSEEGRACYVDKPHGDAPSQVLFPEGFAMLDLAAASTSRRSPTSPLPAA